MHLSTQLERCFARIGARLIETTMPSSWRWDRNDRFFSLDVLRDKQGEYFCLVLDANVRADVVVLNVQPKARHLTIMARRMSGQRWEKPKFLCGIDEGHWFVAAIPENAGVSTVGQALQALKPEQVRVAEARIGLTSKQALRRRNRARVRQGEWFFVPAPRFDTKGKFVLRNEPLNRGNGGKSHWMDECVRQGGETVYVCFRHPAGLDQAEYERLLSRDAGARKWGWRIMRRNAEVYARGFIRHRDHKTVYLHDWHRVFMNTESQSAAMRHLVFLD